MPVELITQEVQEAIHSLKKYFSSELEMELSDLQAKLLLDFIVKEIGPLSYNRGIQHSEEFIRKRLEDLSATCFEPPFTYWSSKQKR